MRLCELFGKKIKEIRKLRNLTQQELAELCDMHTTSIGLLEVGARKPSFDTIELIAEKLEVEVKELFNFHCSYQLNDTEEKLKKVLDREIKDFDLPLLRHMINYAKSLKELLKNK